MLDLLLILIFTAHLLAVNVATGAPFLALWCERRETRHGDQLAGKLGRYLAQLSNRSLGVGILLGLLTLALLAGLRPQYLGNLARVPGRMVWLGVSDRIWFGLAELAIFSASMWAYQRLWDRLDFRKASHIWSHRALGWFAGLNILYHLPPLFAIAAVLNERPELASQNLKYIQLMFDPEVVARVMHTWLSAFAVSGVAVMVWSLVRERAGDAQEDVRRAAIWGARMALAPTVLQVLAGTWLTFQLPETARRDLMGGDWLGSGCFLLAIVASIYLMHHLASASMGEVERPAVKRTLVLLVCVVLLMVTVRHRCREQTITTHPHRSAGLHPLVMPLLT